MLKNNTSVTKMKENDWFGVQDLGDLRTLCMMGVTVTVGLVG